MINDKWGQRLFTILMGTATFFTKKSLSPIQKVAVPFLISVLICFFMTISVYADMKQWSGRTDALSWAKDGNWFPGAIPTLLDDVFIDLQDASVNISDYAKGFKAKSITAGGRTDSTLTMGSFVYGTITPENNTDNALYIRKGGTVIAQGGGGTVTLKGALKFYEADIPDEPAFIFGAE